MSERKGDVLVLDKITRGFGSGAARLEVLKGVSLAVRPGEMVALVGPSGCGKSTLLHITGLLEKADSGDVVIDGKAANSLADDERTAIRRSTIGFVYQYHHLLREFSAAENIALPQMIAGAGRRPARQRAEELLASVGLAKRAEHRPAELSGGEQQRVALARALANRPKLLLADEPTGNLDERTADEVFALLQNLVRGTGVSALIATHNLSLAQRMDRRITLHDGLIQAL
ncbi:MAG TPA: ABC transporter ATP-binding protein [Dongiaceae bacterium]